LLIPTWALQEKIPSEPRFVDDFAYCCLTQQLNIAERERE